jgi:hypothetical protein
MIRAPLTHDHGTPPEYVALMHEVFDGHPDLDPSSHPKWNETIRAKRIITEEMDARVSPWFPTLDAPLPHRLLTDRRCLADHLTGELVFSNPPNDADGSLVSFFWRTYVEYFLRGYARAVIVVGFNVEQLARNQRIGARSSPLKHPTIVPAERPRYLDGDTLKPQTQPMHASFITLLTHEPAHIRRFAALGRELGDVVNVHGY